MANGTTGDMLRQVKEILSSLPWHPQQQREQLGQTLYNVAPKILQGLEVINPILGRMGGLPETPVPPPPLAPPPGVPPLDPRGRAIEEPEGPPIAQQVPPPGQSGITVRGVPGREVPYQVAPISRELAPIPSTESLRREYREQLTPEERQRQKREMVDKLQEISLRRSEEQKVGGLGRQISQIDRQRAEMMQAREMPTGAAGWGEAILSRLSRGDAGAIHAEREAKREKALGVLKSRQEELVAGRKRIRDEQKEKRGEDIAATERDRNWQYRQNHMKYMDAQTGSLQKPQAGLIVKRGGSWVKPFVDPITGKEAYAIPAMPPNIDRFSEEGIEAQKRIEDYRAGLQRDLLDRAYERSETPEQKRALDFISLKTQQAIASANAEAAGVYGSGASVEQVRAAAALADQKVEDAFWKASGQMREVIASPDAKWSEDLFPRPRGSRPKNVPPDLYWVEDPQTGEIKVSPTGEDPWTLLSDYKGGR
jgi:hypothetical protein